MNQQKLPNSVVGADSEKSEAPVTGASKILFIQLIVVLLTVIGFFCYQDLYAAQSAAFGGSIAMLNVWQADRSLHLAANTARLSPGSEVTILYLGIIQRFVVTLVLFVAGMLWLKLSPLALMSAFAVAQLGFLLKKP